MARARAASTLPGNLAAVFMTATIDGKETPNPHMKTQGQMYKCTAEHTLTMAYA
jgi:hypothetical protein